MSNLNAATPQPGRAAFQGYWMAPGSLGGVPAWLIVEHGQVALMTPGESTSGFVDVFRVPVGQAKVSSAAQRITVTVDGTAYPVLARPRGTLIGPALGVAGSAAGLAGSEVGHGAGTVARGGNLAADAAAFSRQGGPQFLAAVRQSGAAVRRVGYGALLGVGLTIGLLIVVLVTVIAVVAVS